MLQPTVKIDATDDRAARCRPSIDADATGIDVKAAALQCRCLTDICDQKLFGEYLLLFFVRNMATQPDPVTVLQQSGRN